MSDIILPNRPDSLGAYHDSQARESKYAAAVRRFVKMLETRARPVDKSKARGKRRSSFPTKRDRENLGHTGRAYLAAIEKFSNWTLGVYGYELSPEQVTREVCFDFVMWLMEGGEPNVYGLSLKSLGEHYYEIFRAIENLQKRHVDVGIDQIFEALPPRIASNYRTVGGKLDGEGLKNLHKDLGIVVRTRAIIRSPTVATLRAKHGFFSSAEKDPFTYRYAACIPKALKPPTVLLTVSGLALFWDVLLEGENIPGGEAPLKYNPWRGRTGPFPLLHKHMKEYLRRKDSVISHAIVNALVAATIGTGLENRRNNAIINTLIYTGVRAEELVGLLRKDLVSVDGVLSIRVIGKGDKERYVPIFSDVRDSYAKLDAELENMLEESGQTEQQEFESAYAKELLDNNEAPLIPALPRWGFNARAEPPEKQALEPLDTSGLRAVLSKIAGKARVLDKRTGVVRGLTPQEKKKVHPHALRHYAATAAKDAGLPIEDIKVLLGHSSIMTTERYVHVSTRSVAQFGAYISHAREGKMAMSAEEADRLRQTRQSVLEDPDISASTPLDVEQIESPAELRKKPEKIRDDQIEHTKPEIIKSPDWAYKLGAEKRVTYTPKRTARKGEQIMYTFRIGQMSRLPWWAGRSGRWSEADWPPVMSFYQLFTDMSDVDIKPDLQETFNVVLATSGVTAASAYAEWVSELVGTAASGLFRTMLTREDDWIAFWDSANAGDESVVRMHDNKQVIAWLKENARDAAASVIRTPPQWDTWEFPITVVDEQQLSEEPPSFRTVIKTDHRRAGFLSSFRPDASVRFSANDKWLHAKVESRTPTGVIALVGERLPKPIKKFQTATGGERKGRGTHYPTLTNAKDLPSWFFSKDPLLDLPPKERAELREWVDQLQGIKPTATRVISAAKPLADMLASLRDADDSVRQAKTDEERRLAKSMQREVDLEIRAYSKEVFGIDIDPKEAIGAVGKRAAETESLNRLLVSDAPLEALEAKEVGKYLKKLPQIERRTMAYLMMKGHKADLTDFQLKEIIREREGILGMTAFRWSDEGTIVHDETTKRRFYLKRGTDSECVARRTLRSLWEMRREKGKTPHKDIIRRHTESLMAYLVPCADQMEQDLRDRLRVTPEPPDTMQRFADTLRGDRLSEELQKLWEETMTEGPMGARVGTGTYRAAQRAREIEQTFKELEGKYAGEGTLAEAKPNAAMMAWLDGMLTPIDLIVALHWPV